MNSKRKKKSIIIWSVIVLAGAAFALSKTVFAPENLQDVTVETPKVRDVTEIITANGKIQPEVEVKISPEVSGEIVELTIKEGDWVNKGDLLVRIRPDTYLSAKESAEAMLKASEANYQQTQATYRLAEQTFQRQKKLYDGNAISKAEYESAEASLKQAEAQIRSSEANIESSRAKLKQAEEDLLKTTIYAPSNGTINSLSVELGERVVGTATMAGTDMLSVADLSYMEVRADVNENDIVRVQLGDSAYLEVDAYLGRKFKGIVTRIANSTSSKTTTTSTDQVTTYEVRIKILPESYADLEREGVPSPFRPSMSATVEIMTDNATALSIPIQCITTRANQQGGKSQVAFVYDADSSIVHQVKVETGIQDKNYIIVKSGIDENMSVVTAPFIAISKELVDGQKVVLTSELGPNSVRKEQSTDNTSMGGPPRH